MWLARLFFANIVWWWLLVTITRLVSANMSNWTIGDWLFFVPFLCSIGSQIIARCGEFNGSATSIHVDSYELGWWINLGFWLFWVMRARMWFMIDFGVMGLSIVSLVTWYGSFTWTCCFYSCVEISVIHVLQLDSLPICNIKVMGDKLVVLPFKMCYVS